MACETSSFTTDAAKKFNVSKRTIEQEIQITENLTEEAKDFIRKKRVSKKKALFLARKKPEEQLNIVEQIKNEKPETIKEAINNLTPRKPGKKKNIKITKELYDKLTESIKDKKIQVSELVEKLIKDFLKNSNYEGRQ